MKFEKKGFMKIIQSLFSLRTLTLFQVDIVSIAHAYAYACYVNLLLMSLI